MSNSSDAFHASARVQRRGRRNVFACVCVDALLCMDVYHALSWFFPFFIHRNICRNSCASLLLSVDNLRNSNNLYWLAHCSICVSDRGVIAFCVDLQSRANRDVVSHPKFSAEVEICANDQ